MPRKRKAALEEEGRPGLLEPRSSGMRGARPEVGRVGRSVGMCHQLSLGSA